MPTPEQMILAADRILVLCHTSPDGDAIGALLAMGHILRALGKQTTLACADPVPREYRFMPGADEVVQRPEGEFDLVISLDSSDIPRLGEAYDASRLGHLPILNIDHHITNLDFGTVNWVEPGSASTCQLVLRLADGLGVDITPEIATCLLSGIVMDTRGFTTPNTDLAALRAAERLVAAGANLAGIARRILVQRSFAMTKLWGEALSQARLEDGIVWASLPASLMAQSDASANGLSGLVAFLAGVEEARVAVLFRERDDGRVEVSLRSVPGVDVSGIALSLGGGGHPQAAGCTLAGPLAEVESRVLGAVRALLDGSRRADG
ncbi:MAG: bifunctional oligoribonuclease/PAP phosphatase NrnA [Chloroflexi bacterium]|nr:bifunctional oligoribonuclease/PAP phosphatase NrnA [Chloroflexota bacterium]